VRTEQLAGVRAWVAKQAELTPAEAHLLSDMDMSYICTDIAKQMDRISAELKKQIDDRSGISH
jgi:hypothetical protein